MDDSSKDAIFASSLKAAAAATAGSSASKQVIFQKSEDGERLAKVERLRRQIAAGEYPTNTAEISKRLIDDHLAR